VSRKTLRLGTRKSPMAMAQSARVAQLITERTGHPVELVGMSSFGDVTGARLDQIGGQGVFVSALRSSLAAGDVDLAVHSLKDLPTAAVPGITLAAIPPRDDPRDALVGKDGAKLADLPEGARIGTGSPRRAAQLRLMRPGLLPVPVRGNAGTRMAKVTSGELDAVVLACAGLARLNQLDVITQVFDVEEMLPAPGQGALAVECRTADEPMISLLTCVDDPSTRAAVCAERMVLAQLEAGCSAPVGAYAAGTEVLQLTAVAMGEDGGPAVRARRSGPASQAEQLGRDVAAELLRRGAGKTTAASAAASSDGDDAQ
jgi:hydroxymethylbilane synthase